MFASPLLPGKERGEEGQGQEQGERGAGLPSGSTAGLGVGISPPPGLFRLPATFQHSAK